MKFMIRIKSMQLTKMVVILSPLLLGGVGGGLLASCSDWDDHYDAETSVTESQRQSLMANIQQNPDLSQFASLLSKSGYGSLLNQAQTHTVWAPKNGTFDYEALMAETDADVKRQFIENHIARNNYPASGTVNERIYMLNNKVMNFTSAGSGYTMQDVQLQLPSIGGNNGTIHLIDGKIPYLRNIYESLNNQDFAIDSVAVYYHDYDTLLLDETKSVKGPAVNGVITYLDTIYTEHNDLYNMFNAYINREDSSYTMLVPTNNAWTKAKEHIKSFFQYNDRMRIRNFVNNGNGWEKKDTTINITNPTGLQDSIASRWLMNRLFFNNRLYDNAKLADLQDGEMLAADSLVSTMGWTFQAPEARKMLTGAQRVDKSNGNIFILDELVQPSWVGLCPPIKIEAENLSRIASYENLESAPDRQRVTSSNQNKLVTGQISNGYYLNLQPYSQNTDQKVTFTLPNVRSATYHAFLVVVPKHITNKYVTEADLPQLKPNRLKVTVGYSNINATSKLLELKEEGLRSKENKSYFETNPTQIDTLDLGEITFPMCYSGLGTYYPYIRVETNSRKENERELRLDCIMLIPKELMDNMGGTLNHELLQKLW